MASTARIHLSFVVLEVPSTRRLPVSILTLGLTIVRFVPEDFGLSHGRVGFLYFFRWALAVMGLF